MEHMIQLHIEKLPEGMYLATSDEVQGLVAQGRRIQETIEIARDVARKLIEAQSGTSTAQLAPGSTPRQTGTQRFRIIRAICRRARFERSSTRPGSRLMCSCEEGERQRAIALPGLVSARHRPATARPGQRGFLTSP